MLQKLIVTLYFSLLLLAGFAQKITIFRKEGGRLKYPIGQDKYVFIVNPDDVVGKADKTNT